MGTWLPIADLALSQHCERPLSPLPVGGMQTQAAVGSHFGKPLEGTEEVT